MVFRIRKLFSDPFADARVNPEWGKTSPARPERALHKKRTTLSRNRAAGLVRKETPRSFLRTPDAKRVAG